MSSALRNLLIFVVVVLLIATAVGFIFEHSHKQAVIPSAGSSSEQSSTDYTQTNPFPMGHCSYSVTLSAATRYKAICRKSYLSFYDMKAKIPYAVQYTLEPSHALGCLKRTNNFATDQSLPDEAAAHKSDYAKSGYDIGHMANAADMEWDFQSVNESFILSNMTPQLPALNRGIWKKLEGDIREWAYGNNHTLMVIAGSIYSPSSKTIGDGVVVPDAFYKIVYDTVNHQYIAFVFKNQKYTDFDLSHEQVTLSTIEKMAGTTFNGLDNKNSITRLWPEVDIPAKGSVCSVHG